MPPFSFKSPMFLAGTSVVGTGGVSVAGWQIGEEVNITTDKKLVRQGFRKEIVPKPNLETNINYALVSRTGSSRFQFRPYGCFNSFFPLEGIKSGDFESINHPKIPDPFLVDKVKENIESTQNPMGCALMHLSYTNEKFIFKSEAAVKNDKFGGVIWTGISYDSSKDEHERGLFNYYVLFLKKYSSEKGKVEGGYAGFDAHGHGDKGGDNLTISSPDNENWKDAVVNSQGSSPKEQKYSGIWEAAKNGNKEIFEEIHVHDADAEEILGKKLNSEGEFKFEASEHHGYKSASAGYNTTSNKWQELSVSSGGGVDISKTLDTLYLPFKGRRGSGTKVEDYCENKPKEKYLSSEDFETLKRLCYKQSATS